MVLALAAGEDRPERLADRLPLGEARVDADATVGGAGERRGEELPR